MKLAIAIWIVVIAGIYVMKKIQPHNSWYIYYAIAIGLLFTLAQYYFFL